jgi:hypothetical protein
MRATVNFYLNNGYDNDQPVVLITSAENYLWLDIRQANCEVTFSCNHAHIALMQKVKDALTELIAAHQPVAPVSAPSPPLDEEIPF